MHRLFVWLGSSLGRPRRLLIFLGICVLVLAASCPFLWTDYHWYAAQAALQRYRNAEARGHLNACRKVWPWSRSVHMHLLAARAARRDGDFMEASRLLQEVQSSLGDHSQDTLLEWALLQAASGDLNKVERQLRDLASKEEPKTLPLILEALAVGYAHWSRFAEALQCVDEWLARDPDNVQALFLRSSIHRQRGSWTRAAPDLRRVVELDPERPWARWWLAVALVNIGRYNEALGHLAMLRQETPEELDKTEVLVRLAVCWHSMGRVREARQLLDEVLAQHPDHGLALLTRGEIDLMNGELPQAEKWLRQAVRVLPDDFKAHWYLRECLRQQGKAQ